MKSIFESFFAAQFLCFRYEVSLLRFCAYTCVNNHILSGGIRQNKTPKGDGNVAVSVSYFLPLIIRQNKTPKGDGYTPTITKSSI